MIPAAFHQATNMLIVKNILDLLETVAIHFSALRLAADSSVQKAALDSILAAFDEAIRDLDMLEIEPVDFLHTALGQLYMERCQALDDIIQEGVSSMKDVRTVVDCARDLITQHLAPGMMLDPNDENRLEQANREAVRYLKQKLEPPHITLPESSDETGQVEDKKESLREILTRIADSLDLIADTFVTRRYPSYEDDDIWEDDY